jgi:hypothetical protein
MPHFVCNTQQFTFVRSGFSSFHLTHISLVSFLLSLHFYLGQWSLSKCASDKNLWIQESKASACRFHVSHQFITKRSKSRVIDCWNHNGRTPLNLSSMYQLLVGTTTIKQSSMASAAHFPSLLHLFVNWDDGRAWQPLDNSLSIVKFLPSLWDINWIGDGFYCFASLASPIHGM